MQDMELQTRAQIEKEEKQVAVLFTVLAAMFLFLSFIGVSHGHKYLMILSSFASGANITMALWIFVMRRFFGHTSSRDLYIEALGLFLGRPEFPIVRILLALVVILGAATGFFYSY